MMERLFNISRGPGNSIVFTVNPVEGDDKTAAVVIVFASSDFKDAHADEIVDVIARRIKNGLAVLENHVTLTAKAK